MAVQCPAAGCDYSGLVDQVEGHLGGVADEAHRGLTVSSFQESLHGEASQGLPRWAFGGLILMLVLAVYWAHLSEGDEQSHPPEGLERGELEG